MGFYRRYQKLVKCYSDGTIVVPEEYMKGDLVTRVESDSIDACEGGETDSAATSNNSEENY